MCRAYYSNCRGVLTTFDELRKPCEKQIYIFDWKPCEKAHTRSVCEPTFYPNPAGDLGQCENCESLEKELNPGCLIDNSSIYRVYFPRQEPPSYAPPQYVAPPPYFHSPASSLDARAPTHLQLPPMPLYAESPYADGSKRCRNTTVVNCTTVQQQPSNSSLPLRSSATNDSSNIGAAVTTNTDASSLLRPPPMPTFLESPYARTLGTSNSNNIEQQHLQNTPPVAHAFNCRRQDEYHLDDGESSVEPRVLGLRSQWYETELQSQKSSPWKSFSGWIRKASEKMTGQRRSHQGATQLSRSENLARQPRVKPRRAAIDTWVAASSNLDHEGQ